MLKIESADELIKHIDKCVEDYRGEYTLVLSYFFIQDKLYLINVSEGCLCIVFMMMGNFYDEDDNLSWAIHVELKEYKEEYDEDECEVDYKEYDTDVINNKEIQKFILDAFNYLNEGNQVKTKRRM